MRRLKSWPLAHRRIWQIWLGPEAMGLILMASLAMRGSCGSSPKVLAVCIHETFGFHIYKCCSLFDWVWVNSDHSLFLKVIDGKNHFLFLQVRAWGKSEQPAVDLIAWSNKPSHPDMVCFAFQESLQEGMKCGKLLYVLNLELNQSSNSPEVYRSSSYRLDIWLNIAWSRGACSGKRPAGLGSSVKALFQDLWTPKSSQSLCKTRMAFDSTHL